MKDRDQVRFELNLDAPDLTPEQIASIGSTVRKAAAEKLRHFKFEVEEIKGLHGGAGLGDQGCGGACRACRS